MKFRMFLITMLMAIVAFTAFAQTEIPHDAVYVDAGMVADPSANSYSLGFATPIKSINGYATASLNQVRTDGELESEVALGHIQGGFNLGKTKLALFLDAERNLTKGTDLTTQIGMALKTQDFNVGPVSVNVGVGVLGENTQVNDEIKAELDNTDELTPRILSSISVEYGLLSNTFWVMPNPVEFKGDIKVKATPSVMYQLKENVSLGLNGLAEYDTDPVSKEKLNWQLTSLLRFKL